MPYRIVNRRKTQNPSSQSSAKVLTLATGALLLFYAASARARTIPPSNCMPPPPLGAIIPLYIYPIPPALGMEHPWQPLVDAKDAYPTLDVWAIINPPVDAVACTPKVAGCECNIMDPAYTAGLELLQAHGIRMMGYVTTEHSKVDEPSTRDCIMAKIDTWQKHVIDYASTHGTSSGPIIDAIFFDEMDNVKDRAKYYAEFSEYARDGNHAFKYTVGNPGDKPIQEVADSVTTVVIYEQCGFPSSSFFSGLPAASSRGKFALLPHHQVSVPSAIDIHAVAQHVRYIYVSDEAYPCTSALWQKFPSYLNDLFSKLQTESDSSALFCAPDIPALSAWGAIIMIGLLIITGSILLFRSKRYV
jgi:spherulation-specific family 4 protein